MTRSLLQCLLVKSGFLEVLPLDTGSFLCIHAIAQSRVVLKPEVVEVLESFKQPRRVGDWLDEFCASHDAPRDAVLQAVSSLLESRLLYAGTQEEERRRFAALLSQWYGRDPDEARRADGRWRAQRIPRFSAPVARDLASFAPLGRRLDVVLIGLCETQIGLDVLRDEARAFDLDLNLVPTFESALEVLAETAHEAIVIGPLGQRHGHWHQADGRGDLWPDRYERAARDLVLRVRALSAAPILLHNLPVPTCSPRGHADRGIDTPVERCREINRRLVELATELPDVYVVDVDAALSFAGKRRLLDDRVMTGSHLGGLGWWALLPDVELKNVHGIKPPVEQLEALGVADPFEFDRVVAGAQLSLLSAIFGVGRRDLVVVALDGVLWPGELMATKAPFPPGVDHGTWSFHGFYVGIHEALKGLGARGVRLGGLAAGDEAAVRAWWRYPGKAPLDRLVLPSDFTALRFGVEDPVAALRTVAAEVETEPSRMVFVATDEAARVAARRAFAELLVLGDNFFAVRGVLLTHPSLQAVQPEQEGIEHPAMMVALARREQARKSARDAATFEAQLHVRCAIRRGLDPGDLDRVHELVARTRQFTTTGRGFAREDLAAMEADPRRRLYTMRVEDRFADYGLVGVAIVVENTIELLLLSCRVVGLGVQAVFLRAIVADLIQEHGAVRARVLLLPRNAAARGLFRLHGFTEVEPGLWQVGAREFQALDPLPPHLIAAFSEARLT